MRGWGAFDWVLYSSIHPGCKKGGGDSGYPLFKQTDVGKIPAKVKHLNCKHGQRIADRPTAGIEVLPHYHQLLVLRQGRGREATEAVFLPSGNKASP